MNEEFRRVVSKRSGHWATAWQAFGMRFRFLVFLLLAHALSAEGLPFYIASAGTPDAPPGIYASQLNAETGDMTHPTIIAKLNGAGFLALGPKGDRLLATSKITVGGKETGGMALYEILADGSLKPLSDISTKDRGACHVSFDQTGKVAMAANYSGGSIMSARVSDDGDLSFGSHFQHEGNGPHPGRQKKAHAHSIYPGPENRFAYAADLGTDSVFIYAMNIETAELTPVHEAKTPAGAGPRHLKFSKDGAKAYVLNELNTTVSVFARRDDGNLERAQDLSTLPDDFDNDEITCSEILVHPNGRFVYVANRDTAKQGRDCLSVFQTKEDGSLERIQTLPAKVSIPRNITLSPDGDWLVVCGQASNSLVSFRVEEESGKLSSVGKSTPCPKPMCVVFRK